jgi:hypothetical protein
MDCVQYKFGFGGVRAVYSATRQLVSEYLYMVNSVIVKIMYVLQRDMKNNSDLNEMITEILNCVRLTMYLVSYFEAALLYAVSYKGTYILSICFHRKVFFSLENMYFQNSHFFSFSYLYIHLLQVQIYYCENKSIVTKFLLQVHVKY